MKKDNVNDNICGQWWLPSYIFFSIDIKHKVFEAAYNDHSCTGWCSSVQYFMGKTAFATCSYPELETTCPSEFKHTLLSIDNNKWT